ncbi:hypothetical protein Stsp01_12450 [Streptomyces sp. NBRC 13847]|nr:hypothetical protein Stsp01_12450 [Streptomyces sp. NBRC 13847]
MVRARPRHGLIFTEGAPMGGGFSPIPEAVPRSGVRTHGRGGSDRTVDRPARAGGSSGISGGPDSPEESDGNCYLFHLCQRPHPDLASSPRRYAGITRLNRAMVNGLRG